MVFIEFAEADMVFTGFAVVIRDYHFVIALFSVTKLYTLRTHNSWSGCSLTQGDVLVILQI